jgi:hypothetical protein
MGDFWGLLAGKVSRKGRIFASGRQKKGDFLPYGGPD